MSKYLTPQKISLLVLVNLYTDPALPSSATIPILSFVISHIYPPSSSNARSRPASTSQELSFSISEFDEVLNIFPSSMPGRTLLDVFLSKMWDIKSLDALNDLFNDLEDLLARNREESERDAAAGIVHHPDQIFLSRTSPLGAFIRRARLEFTKLQFHDSLRIWFAFINYRAPTAQWNRRIAGVAGSGIDVNAIGMGLQPGDPLYEVVYGHLDEADSPRDMTSLDDLDRMLDVHIEQLQRQGCRLPDEVRKQLRDLLGPSGTVLKQSHLIKFLDAWKAGDYTSTFDNLHRYYDYAMHNRDKSHYQYALLHMAIVQADFGCFSEAIAAINETISTAREHQDMSCLNFSLSWLNHMSRAYPKQMRGAGYKGMLGSEKDGLIFLKTKAKELKMYGLLSSTLLNEAKFALSTGESVPRAFEYIYQASHLNVRENVNNYGGQMLMQSTLYSRLGIIHLSSVYCELLLHCYKPNSSKEERIRAVCRCAFAAAQTGRYDEALSIFDDIGLVDPENHRTLKFHQFIYNCTGLIKLKRALRRADLDAASHFLQCLQPDASLDPEISFLLTQARIEYHIQSGDFPAAFNLIEDIAEELKEENADLYQRIEILIAKADLWAKSGHPERGFSVALRAASVAFRARLMPSLWEAVAALANILNALSESCAAAPLLDAVIPQALESHDVHLVARLYSLQADAFMGIAGQEDAANAEGVRRRAKQVAKAEFYIDRARERYKRAEDVDGECEMLAKKALIARLRGDEGLAEDWAENYNRTYEEAIKRLGEGVEGVVVGEVGA